MPEAAPPVGGAFLLEERNTTPIFVPEMLNAEARLMARTMDDFVRKEVLPVSERLEAKEEGLMAELLRRAGSLGLLAGNTPERYEGLELPKTALTLLTEGAAPYLSFAISLGVHTGVASLPLLYFGTTAQKQKYLPHLASGELIGAFALSEANSGSDALGAQTRAVLSEDGRHYRLNGEKMWTTNGGFADLFIVFAQADGERFTAFVVEKDTPGLVLGREEHKMGLHGSSTRRVLLQDVLVPIDNVVGEVGKGHYSALYALNVGRFNIGVTALGAAKECLRLATQYAKQRVQFGQSIAHFGLIRHKLAEMAVRIFVLESMVYRVAGYFDAYTASEPNDEGRTRAASEEYAIECALIKFFGTEVLAYVVDEALQIHGGFGYSEEFPIARLYRDARIFRIFEGTNEINRLAVLDQLLRRAAKGRLTLFEEKGEEGEKARCTRYKELEELIANPQSPIPNHQSAIDNSPSKIANPQSLIENRLLLIRHLFLSTLEQGRRQWGENLNVQQEFAGTMADMTASLFALESAWMRANRLDSKQGLPERFDDSGAYGSRALTAVQIYAETACAQVEQGARTAYAALSSETVLPSETILLRILQTRHLVNTVALRHQIAEAVVAQDGYPW